MPVKKDWLLQQPSINDYLQWLLLDIGSAVYHGTKLHSGVPFGDL